MTKEPVYPRFANFPEQDVPSRVTASHQSYPPADDRSFDELRPLLAAMLTIPNHLDTISLDDWKEFFTEGSDKIIAGVRWQDVSPEHRRTLWMRTDSYGHTALTGAIFSGDAALVRQIFTECKRDLWSERDVYQRIMAGGHDINSPLHMSLETRDEAIISQVLSETMDALKTNPPRLQQLFTEVTRTGYTLLHSVYHSPPDPWILPIEEAGLAVFNNNLREARRFFTTATKHNATPLFDAYSHGPDARSLKAMELAHRAFTAQDVTQEDRQNLAAMLTQVVHCEGQHFTLFNNMFYRTPNLGDDMSNFKKHYELLADLFVVAFGKDAPKQVAELFKKLSPDHAVRDPFVKEGGKSFIREEFRHIVAQKTGELYR